MLNTILGALLPVVVTLLLGVLAGWRHDEDTKAAKSLNTMVLTYALPLALFAATVSAKRATLLAQGPLALVFCLGMVVPYVVTYVAARYAAKRAVATSALEAMGFGFPSIPFTGIPILSPLLGDKALVVIAVGGTVINLLIVPATLVFLALDQGNVKKERGDQPKSNVPPVGGGPAQPDQPGNDQPKDQGQPEAQGLGSVLRGALLKPIVLAPLIGLVVVLLGVPVPKLILDAIKLLGSTVGGVSLFASGIILQAQKPAVSWPAILMTVGRNVLVPGLVFLALTLLGSDHNLRKEAVLALSLPAAALQITLAVQHRTAEQENASYLLFSSVLSMLTIALFIWLLG